MSENNNCFSLYQIGGSLSLQFWGQEAFYKKRAIDYMGKENRQNNKKRQFKILFLPENLKRSNKKNC